MVELTLTLSAEHLALLRAAADEAGETIEAFAARLIANGLRYDEWAITEARLAEYDRTGVAEDAEVVFREVREQLKTRLAERPAPAK